MGTWLGATSVCNAAGLALAKAAVHYYAYDYFKFGDPERDSNFEKLYKAQGRIPDIDRVLLNLRITSTRMSGKSIG